MFKHVPIELGYEDLNAETGSGGRFYTTPDGLKYPSITTVLGAGDKSGLIEWRKRVGEEEANRVSHHAATRGTAVHSLMEKYIGNEDVEPNKLLPLYRKSYYDLKKIVDERLDEVYAQEVPLFSHHLRVAGRTDLIGRFDGVRSVVDFKTSGKVKKKEWIHNYFIQGAAYSIMWEERTGMAIPNIVIVMDIDNHEPIVFKEHRDNWVPQLLDAIKEYDRQQRCKVI